MRIFLTGGTGFIGSYVLCSLLRDGHEVLALKRPGSQPRIVFDNQPTWLQGSLADNWDRELAGCDALIHLAAVGVSPQKATWEEYFYWNVTVSVNLMKRAIEMGVRRVVNCGSCMEFGRVSQRFEKIPNEGPLSPVGGYATSKAASSLAAVGLCQEYGVELALLRPFTIYGVGQHHENFWPQMKQAAENGWDLDMTAGDQIRDFLTVDRCAEAIGLAARRPDLEGGAPWIRNIASGKSQSLANFAASEWKNLKAKGKLNFGAIPYRKNEIFRCVPEVSPDLWTELK